jgi:hypothetical protein
MGALLGMQSLLKEKLELERVKSKDGQVRWTLRPIEDQLTFDKVRTVLTGRPMQVHPPSLLT